MNPKRKTSRTVNSDPRMLATVAMIRGGKTHALLSEVACKALEVPGQIVAMPYHTPSEVAALFRRYHFRAHARGNQVSGTIGRLGKWSFLVV